VRVKDFFGEGINSFTADAALFVGTIFIHCFNVAVDVAEGLA
jgi:hypothetical protein